MIWLVFLLAYLVAWMLASCIIMKLLLDGHFAEHDGHCTADGRYQYSYRPYCVQRDGPDCWRVVPPKRTLGLGAQSLAIGTMAPLLLPVLLAVLLVMRLTPETEHERELANAVKEKELEELAAMLDEQQNNIDRALLKSARSSR